MKNPKTNQKFNTDGFAVVDFLDKKEVSHLRKIYSFYKSEHLIQEANTHSTTDTNNLDLINKVNLEITKIIQPKIDKIFSSYETLFTTFLIKKSDKNSETPFHQDPTMVDSFESLSANIWIPLQDMDNSNGNLKVIPGSHKVPKTIVYTPKYTPFYESFRNSLHLYSKEVPVKSGQALIFNNKLVHGSSSNISKKERVSIIIAIKSKKSKWSYYYKDPNSTDDLIEQFELDKLSFSKLEKNIKPIHSKLIKQFSFETQILKESEFKKLIFRNNSNRFLYYKNSFFNKFSKK